MACSTADGASTGVKGGLIAGVNTLVKEGLRRDFLLGEECSLDGQGWLKQLQSVLGKFQGNCDSDPYQGT